MYLYLMGSQPWHVSIKWFTCIHMMMRGEALRGKSTCNFFSLLIQTQGKVVAFLVVRSICWIKFQPLWFAIKKVSTSLMDKALDILIRDCGIQVNFCKIQATELCQVLTAKPTQFPRCFTLFPRHGKAPLGVLIIKYLFPKVM